jgi:hypothetical protein
MASVADWTERYVTSYERLLLRFESRRSQIVDTAGDGWYEYVTHCYGALLQALRTYVLGGALITATAVF